MQPNNRWFFLILAGMFLFGCAGAPTAPDPQPIYGPGTIIAVWNLEDLSLSQLHEPDLGEFITARITESLETHCGFKIVEREKLLLALEELNLGSSQLASENTRLRIGKILGARLMIFGAYQIIGNITRLDLRLVNVEQGLVVNTASSEVSSTDLDARLKGAWTAAAELCTEMEK